MQYDVLLIHPPAIYDFRKRIAFPGPIAQTLSESTEQFITIPFGMLSIADYLDRNGHATLVDNLGYRMVSSEEFDAENHIKNISAKVYAVGLHWIVHCQGAIELARLCKGLHPGSLVVLGGLTAACFHVEILQKFEFVDAVIRGEAERPLLQLVKNMESNKPLSVTPSVTCRSDNGRVSVAPLMKPSVDLDDYEFTRLDLLEPKSSIPTHWKIPVCRGCIYNCVACGGSAYSYRTYLGMDRPSFRSPTKIAEDIQKLLGQGVRFIGLSQDPRMGGKKYSKELITELASEKLDVMRLALDLLSPADEDFVEGLSRTGMPTVLTISPESGTYHVRKSHGRNWSDEDCIKTAQLCHKYGVPITFFFMVGLAEETQETIRETWNMWEELCLIDQKARFEGRFGDLERYFPIGGPIIGQMILLDPGSLAFDFPAKYGYRLIFRNLEEYIRGLSAPSWHQWISYETKHLDRNALAKLFLESIENSIYEREKHGMYDKTQATMERFGVMAQRIVIDEVDRMPSFNQTEQSTRLRSLKEALDEYSLGKAPSSEADPYGYRRRMRETLRLSIGLVEGGDTDHFGANIFQLMSVGR
jgi:B12-binding domain/radical SAM domain protein